MSTAATLETGNEDNSNVALPLRNDTFLGVCEAIGQDLGINPNWLRVAFAPFIIVNPVLTVGVYLGLGIAVAVSRRLFPRHLKAQRALTAEATVVEPQDVVEERLAA